MQMVTFEMVRRYSNLRPFLSSPESEAEDIDNMILTTLEMRQFDLRLDNLKEMESVSKALQEEKTSLSVV